MKKLKLAMTIALSVVVMSALAGPGKKADKDTQQFRYDIEYAQSGANGMILVKVWTYSKNQNVAAAQSQKNAIHGVIFKGYTSSGAGTISQRPLAKDANAYAEHREFFDSFFADGGNYMKYASAAASPEVRKVGKEYKVGMTVTVAKDELRRDLEAAGVIKGLTSGF